MQPHAQLLRLIHGITTAAPECFFRTLVRELAQVLGVDYAFVAELTAGSPMRGRTVALYGDGAMRDNVEYDLDGTPCKDVVERGIALVDGNARTCFPRDAIFADLEIDSYAGIALVDDNAFVGWLAVMHRGAFADEDLVRTVLEFMAARATAELRARILHAALALAHEKSMRDELTQLSNRTHFHQQLELALQAARPFAVLFLDLDRFKVINDSLGHPAGDALLIECALRIRDAIRPCDFAARLGGDEFAVLIDGATESDASHVAQRIERLIEKPFVVANQDVYTTASVGIACSRGQYRDAGDVLRDADTAMYRAKASGKARHALFHSGMHLEAVDRMQIEMDLRRAVEREQLHLVYQPIVAIRDRHVVAHEALLRWRHPLRGMVMPSTFIPIAEETGSIVALGEWVLERVCRDLRDWPDAIANVNLSAVQLQHSDLVERIAAIVRRDASRVRLEVTESAIAAHPDAAAHTLHAIRNLGIHLCIDDFGIGYSSLASLLHLPFSTLKIDRSLVAGLATSIEHREMVAAIATLAHNLGLDIVAEGIETAEQFAVAAELGVDCAQGFYIAKPVPLEDLQSSMLRVNG
jgi:diguanylate cyclase (GGDEF)-like protein